MIKGAYSLVNPAAPPGSMLRLAECRIYHSAPLPLQDGNGALWSIRFKRTDIADLSGCWGTRGAEGTIERGAFAA